MKGTAREQALMDQVPVGRVVQHYKGMQMRVLAVARHTEDQSLLVVYQKLYDCEHYGKGAIVVRPLEMFLESVLVNGDMVPRFKVVETHECAHC